MRRRTKKTSYQERRKHETSGLTGWRETEDRFSRKVSFLKDDWQNAYMNRLRDFVAINEDNMQEWVRRLVGKELAWEDSGEYTLEAVQAAYVERFTTEHVLEWDLMEYLPLRLKKVNQVDAPQNRH